MKAASYENLGFGLGYAVAPDRLCVIADRAITLRGERARWHGADGAGLVGFLRLPNVDADLFHRVQLSEEKVRLAMSQLEPRTRALIRGYAKGINHYVAQQPPLGKRCDGNPIPEIGEADIVRNMLSIGTTWKAFEIAPFAAASTWGAPGDRSTDAAPRRPAGNMASNAWAFGGAAASTDSAIVMGNPHTFWRGDEWLLMHQLHLTIPGELDVAGADFVGLPFPLAGFNRSVAWSVEAPITVTYYVLQAMKVRTEPAPAYLIDGQWRPIRLAPTTLGVKDDGDAVETRTFAIPYTELGPLYRLPATPTRPAGWYAVTDAGDGNARGLDQLLAASRADSVAAFRQAIEDNRGVGAHFIAGDADGNALYIESGPLLDLDETQLADCRLAGEDIAFNVLDGSRGECGVRGAAGHPRLAPATMQPAIVTDGIIHNVNNSYHRSVYGRELTGYSPLLGNPAASEQSFRLLMSRKRIGEIMADGKATPQEVLDLVYDNRNYAAETFLDIVLQSCALDEGNERLARGCSILANWDRRNDRRSRGALLFHKLWPKLTEIERPGRSCAVGESSCKETVNVAAAIEDALGELAELSLGGDEAWGEMVARRTPQGRVPLHGGPEAEGVLNVIEGAGLDRGGFADIVSGSAYLQRVWWKDGMPVADVVLAHGQSSDPSSPHFADQLRIFSEKRLVRFPYLEADIRRDPDYRSVMIRSGD